MERTSTLMSRVTSQPLQAVFQRVPLFAGLDIPNLDQLVAISSWLDIPKGYCIMRQGYEADSFYVVVSGTVRIFKNSPGGREFTFAVLRSGHTIGAAPLITNEPSPFSADALTPSLLVALRSAAFRSFLERNGSMALRMAKFVVRGFDSTRDTVMALLTDEAPIRVIRVLVALTSDFGRIVPFNHQQIADMAGVTRATASEVLARLSESRVTRSLRGSVAILDKDGLRALSHTSG